MNSNFDLQNKTALITGAAGLLGYEHAMALLESRSSIIITDIDKKKLDELNIKLKQSKPNANIYNFYLDVANLKSVIDLKEKLHNQNLFVDILINNAAINPKVENNSLFESSRLENFSNMQWDLELKVGLTGAFNCCKIFGEDMVSRKGGVILNIASDLSVIAPDQRLYKLEDREKNNQPVKPVSYSVIKHGLIGLTKYVATYWAEEGLRCNALSPGGVFNSQGEIFISKVNKLIPLGRMANKDEYRGAIQFLCSNASSYMNGQNLIMDGGRSVW